MIISDKRASRSYQRRGWEYNDTNECYFYGIESNGCGVYLMNNEWFGNIIKKGSFSVQGIGPYNSFQEACKICEDLFNGKEN